MIEKQTITERSTKYEILDAIAEDGFTLDSFDALPIAEAIQRAARRGTLLWTGHAIVTLSRPVVATRGRHVFLMTPNS